ncbi:MAG TPA: hypothetical protein VH417_01920 [Vicinamibacterales bacterium]|jgi:hypothetical protein
MNIDRARTAVDSEAVERTLRAALRVEPSPEFVARVRTRIAEEPVPGGWTLRWITALAAAAAVILAIAFVASRSARPQAPGVARTSLPPVTAAPGPAMPSEPSRTPPIEPVQTPAARPPVRSVAPRPRVPRTDEEQALREFLNAVDRGAITLAISPVARSGEDRATTIPDLAIAPISISDLAVDPIAQ